MSNIANFNMDLFSNEETPDSNLRRNRQGAPGDHFRPPTNRVPTTTQSIRSQVNSHRTNRHPSNQNANRMNGFSNSSSHRQPSGQSSFQHPNAKGLGNKPKVAPNLQGTGDYSNQYQYDPSTNENSNQNWNEHDNRMSETTFHQNHTQEPQQSNHDSSVNHFSQNTNATHQTAFQPNPSNMVYQMQPSQPLVIIQQQPQQQVTQLDLIRSELNNRDRLDQYKQMEELRKQVMSSKRRRPSPSARESSADPDELSRLKLALEAKDKENRLLKMEKDNALRNLITNSKAAEAAIEKVVKERDSELAKAVASERAKAEVEIGKAVASERAKAEVEIGKAVASERAKAEVEIGKAVASERAKAKVEIDKVVEERANAVEERNKAIALRNNAIENSRVNNARVQHESIERVQNVNNSASANQLQSELDDWRKRYESLREENEYNETQIALKNTALFNLTRELRNNSRNQISQSSSQGSTTKLSSEQYSAEKWLLVKITEQFLFHIHYLNMAVPRIYNLIPQAKRDKMLTDPTKELPTTYDAITFFKLFQDSVPILATGHCINALRANDKNKPRFTDEEKNKFQVTRAGMYLGLTKACIPEILQILASKKDEKQIDVVMELLRQLLAVKVSQGLVIVNFVQRTSNAFIVSGEHKQMLRKLAETVLNIAKNPNHSKTTVNLDMDEDSDSYTCLTEYSGNVSIEAAHESYLASIQQLVEHEYDFDSHPVISDQTVENMIASNKISATNNITNTMESSQRVTLEYIDTPMETSTIQLTPDEEESSVAFGNIAVDVDKLKVEFLQSKNERAEMLSYALRVYADQPPLQTFFENYFNALYFEWYVVNASQELSGVTYISDEDRKCIASKLRLKHFTHPVDVFMLSEDFLNQYIEKLEHVYTTLEINGPNNDSSVYLMPSQKEPPVDQITQITPCMEVTPERSTKIDGRAERVDIIMKFRDGNGQQVSETSWKIQTQQFSAKAKKDISRHTDTRWTDKTTRQRRDLRLQASHQCHNPKCIGCGHLIEEPIIDNNGKCRKRGWIIRDNRLLQKAPTCQCPNRCLGVVHLPGFDEDSENAKFYQSDLNQVFTELKGEGISQYLRLPNNTFLLNPLYKGNNNKKTFVNVSFSKFNKEYNASTSFGYCQPCTN